MEKYSFHQKRKIEPDSSKISRDPATSEAEFFQSFRGLETIKEPTKQDLLVKKMMEYYLKNDYFDEMGNTKHLEQEEFKSLLNYVAVKYHSAVGKPNTLKGIIEKYGLDRKVMKNMLEKEKSRIDSMIRQLEDL